MLLVITFIIKITLFYDKKKEDLQEILMFWMVQGLYNREEINKMLVFDKLKIREALTSENIFDLLQEFGGDPGREVFGFTSATICHNPPGEGSRKLYYYENT